MRKTFGFLMGIAVGGLVCGTIALLLAPESGDDLRAQMRDRGQNFYNDVRNAADERRIELRRRLEELRTPREEMTPPA
jgi:gas vesicle protein